MILVQINGVDYENFISVTARRSIETITGTFEAVATIDKFGNFPIKLQDTVRILVEGQSVINGFIEVIEPSYDNTSHTIRLAGRDKTADVIDSSVKAPFSLSPSKGTITLKTTIEKLLEGNGINIGVIDLVNPKPFGAGDTLDAEVGQNMFEVIDKYCQKRQVLATTDGNGNIVIARGSTNLIGARLVHRDTNLVSPTPQTDLGPEFPPITRENNILSASARYSMAERFNEYAVLSQSNLGSLLSAAIASNTSSIVDQPGSAKDTDVRASRFLSIPADTSNDVNTSVDRAIWEANVRRSRGFSYQCSVQGFLATEDQIWAPNFLVSVKDGKADIDSQLLIKTVEYNSSDAGTVTTLEMSYKDSFNLQAERSVIDSRSNKFGVDV